MNFAKQGSARESACGAYQMARTSSAMSQGISATDPNRTDPQQLDLDDPRGPDFLVTLYGGGFFDNNDKSPFRPVFAFPRKLHPFL